MKELNPLQDMYSGVSLIDSMGTDLTVVNAARVSFAKLSKSISAKDKALIAYLAKNKHTSPFRHVYFTFHVRAPEYVARQWYKHVVGANFNDAGWNEVSQRWANVDMLYYVPDHVIGDLREEFHKAARKAADLYNEMLEAGVPREEARAILPMGTYTEFYWSASLQAVAHFIKLRTHERAQPEIQAFARCVYKLAEKVAPLSLEALLEEST